MRKRDNERHKKNKGRGRGGEVVDSRLAERRECEEGKKGVGIREGNEKAKREK